MLRKTLGFVVTALAVLLWLAKAVTTKHYLNNALDGGLSTPAR
jgi:hypothetical protein